MNRDFAYDRRRVAKRKRASALMLLAAVVLFAGLILQITMLARISAQNKAAVKAEREILELSASAENLALSINQYHNLEEIAVRATQMGLEQPDDTQIRVVSVAQSVEEPSTRVVELTDDEKILN